MARRETAHQECVEADCILLALWRLGHVQGAHTVLDGHPFAAAALGTHLFREKGINADFATGGMKPK